MGTAVDISSPGEVYTVGMRALTDALGRDGAAVFMRHSAGKPGRDFAKWLNEQPEKSEGDIDARIMAIQDAMARGEIDFAGRPVGKRSGV